jgi:Fe-S-cluster containining protein
VTQDFADSFTQEWECTRKESIERLILDSAYWSLDGDSRRQVILSLKFECKMCGGCCRNIRGRVFGRLEVSPFIFMAFPPSLKTIGLFEWEVPILSRMAKSLSIDLRIRPDFMLWDGNKQRAVVLLWNLDHDDCPFLSSSKRCEIYKTRPLVCQSYPLMAIGILGPWEESELFLGDRSLNIEGGDCPNLCSFPIPDGKHSLPIQVLWSTLFKAFGETFLGALRYDYAGIILSKTLGDAVSQRILSPVKMKKDVIKATMRSKPIGMLELLQKEIVTGQEEIWKRINAIYSYSIADLEKMIRQL